MWTQKSMRRRHVLGTVDREVCPGQQVFKNMASHEEGKGTEDFNCNTRGG